VAKSGTGALGAARFSALAFGLSVVLVYVLLRVASGRIAGIIASIAFIFNRSTITVFSYAWSETLFVPLSLACCWIACQASEPLGDRNRWRRFFAPPLLCVTLAAVFYCRYIGLTFSVVLLTSWILSRNRGRFDIVRIAVIALYLALVGLALVRNYLLTGELSGGRRPPSTMGIAEIIQDLGEAILLQVRHEPLPSLVVLLAALAVTHLFRATVVSGDGIGSEGGRRKSIVLLITSSALGASYAVGVVTARSLREFDRIDVRLVTPCVVFLIVMLTVASVRLLTGGVRSRRATAVAALGLATLSLSTIEGIGVYRRAVVSLNQAHSPSLEARKGVTYNSFTFAPKTDSLTGFIENIDADPSAVFVTEDAAAFSFVTRRRSFEFPRNPITDDDISAMNALSDQPGYVFVMRPDSIRRLSLYYGGDWSPVHSRRRFWDGTALVLALPLPTVISL
jgi:hypothetical protein